MKSVDPGLISTLIIGLIYVSLVAMVVTTLKVRKKIDTLLSKCKVVADNRATFGGLGFMGDVMRVGLVCNILLIPRAYTKKNLIDEKQVTGFPRSLKVMILASWGLISLAFFTMFVFRIYLYFA